MQAIYRKARELQEERGIKAGYLATGLARWDELFLDPAAPVLLRPLTISPTRARYDDFDLTLDEETEVNPVLLHKLATVFDAAIDKPDPRPHRRPAGQGRPRRRDPRLPHRQAQGHRHLHLREAADGPRPRGGGRPAGGQRPGGGDRRRPPTRSSWSPRPTPAPTSPTTRPPAGRNRTCLSRTPPGLTTRWPTSPCSTPTPRSAPRSTPSSPGAAWSSTARPAPASPRRSPT